MGMGINFVSETFEQERMELEILILCERRSLIIPGRQNHEEWKFLFYFIFIFILMNGLNHFLMWSK